MTCAEARDLVLEHQAHRLEPGVGRLVEAHLAACAACARNDRAERRLTTLLAAGLPRAPAPSALVRRIAARAPGAAAPAGRRGSPIRPRVAALLGAAAGLALAGAALLVSGAGSHGAEALAAEAVDDHLRVLVAQRPLEIEDGGVHQVKPWFEGRLDFAPTVPDLAPLGLALRGGAVGFLHDRRAAVLQYQLRAHLVTLLAFRADGLPLGGTPRRSGPDRGFHAVLWRVGPVGYALVADVEPHELDRIAAALAQAR
jgi:anti-sigma factor RsiW